VKVKPPSLPVIESDPVKLVLVAPDYVKIEEEFEVVTYGEDEKLNVCEKYEGNLDISVLNGEDNFSYKMRIWDQKKDLDRNSFEYSLHKPGIYYLKAVDSDRGLTAISNPIIVSEELPEKSLFWGEIHVHSQVSDGRGELQDVYRDGFARGLDFIAITDHSFGRDERGSLEERINNICKEADRFNRPGEFVAIPAGETHYMPVMHMNMYFDEANPEKIIHLANTISETTKDLRKNWKSMTPDQLAKEIVPYWDVFKSEAYRNNTLVFPHHTMWLGIKSFIDPERTRVIEVCSVHGTSEIRDQTNTPKPLRMKQNRMEGDQDRKFSVREILNDGIRLGFVGGSDSHEGQAGNDAITGVFCSELTRESIIQGIYNKNCYATSSNRTLFDVKEGSGGYSCQVAGDGNIDKVQVIYNGVVVYEPEFSGRICEFDWSIPDNKGGYFYIKVLMDDGEEAAWSGPIWI